MVIKNSYCMSTQLCSLQSCAFYEAMLRRTSSEVLGSWQWILAVFRPTRLVLRNLSWCRLKDQTSLKIKTSIIASEGSFNNYYNNIQTVIHVPHVIVWLKYCLGPTLISCLPWSHTILLVCCFGSVRNCWK